MEIRINSEGREELVLSTEEAKELEKQRIANFIKKFYERNGEAMSELASEKLGILQGLSLQLLESARELFFLYEQSAWRDFKKEGITEENWQGPPNREFIIACATEDNEGHAINSIGESLRCLNTLAEKLGIDWIIKGKVGNIENTRSYDDDLLKLIYSADGKKYTLLDSESIEDRFNVILTVLQSAAGRLKLMAQKVELVESQDEEWLKVKDSVDPDFRYEYFVESGDLYSAFTSINEAVESIQYAIKNPSWASIASTVIDPETTDQHFKLSVTITSNSREELLALFFDFSNYLTKKDPLWIPDSTRMTLEDGTILAEIESSGEPFD